MTEREKRLRDRRRAFAARRLAKERANQQFFEEATSPVHAAEPPSNNTHDSLRESYDINNNSNIDNNVRAKIQFDDTVTNEHTNDESVGVRSAVWASKRKRYLNRRKGIEHVCERIVCSCVYVYVCAIGL